MIFKMTSQGVLVRIFELNLNPNPGQEAKPPTKSKSYRYNMGQSAFENSQLFKMYGEGKEF